MVIIIYCFKKIYRVAHLSPPISNLNNSGPSAPIDFILAQLIVPVIGFCMLKFQVIRLSSCLYSEQNAKPLKFQILDIRRSGTRRSFPRVSQQPMQQWRPEYTHFRALINSHVYAKFQVSLPLTSSFAELRRELVKNDRAMQICHFR